MSSLEIGTDITLGRVTEEQHRKAALHIADRIAREHPHPLDDVMPRSAGVVIARNPQARADMDDLLDMVFGNNPPRRNP